MKRYEPSLPRVALGLTAIAAAALNLGALVVLPAELSPLEDPQADKGRQEALLMHVKPHVDEGRAMLDSRARRHELVARALVRGERGDAVHLADTRN